MASLPLKFAVYWRLNLEEEDVLNLSDRRTHLSSPVLTSTPLPPRFLFAREAATLAPHRAAKFPDRAKQAVTFHRRSPGLAAPGACPRATIPLQLTAPGGFLGSSTRPLHPCPAVQLLPLAGENAFGGSFSLQFGREISVEIFIPAAPCSKVKEFSLCLKKLWRENTAGRQGEQRCL